MSIDDVISAVVAPPHPLYVDLISSFSQIHALTR
jgi:hypothetical protein